MSHIKKLKFENVGLEVVYGLDGNVGISEEKVDIEFNPMKFRREKMPENLEREIEEIWKSKSESNPRLYNAPKFSFRSISQKMKNESELNSLLFQLQVGITCYKEMMGTHYSPKRQDILDLASNRTDPYCYMSNSMGVGAMAVTRDDFVILIVRAKWTGEYGGMICRPGGHPEPDNVIKEMNGCAKNNHKISDFSCLDPSSVLHEIFMSPQFELRDEVNIPLECQKMVGLLGVIRSLDDGGRVGLDFQVRVDCDKEDILKRYSIGSQSEADETTKLIFVEIEKVKSWNFDPEFYSKLTPHCKGGLRMLHISLNSCHQEH